MADKKQLPPPPGSQSYMEKALAGIKDYFGPRQPIAASRITRTPIYPPEGFPWPENKAGDYSPISNQIQIKGGYLQEVPSFVIPHESAHAIFNQAGLEPSAPALANSGPGPQAQSLIAIAPNLYRQTPETMANEGLAYSIGTHEGTPFVEHVASRISDPALAQQLLRLHRNALATRGRATVVNP